eukprot:1535561-Rhodomonas_salina.2
MCSISSVQSAGLPGYRTVRYRTPRRLPFMLAPYRRSHSAPYTSSVPHTVDRRTLSQYRTWRSKRVGRYLGIEGPPTVSIIWYRHASAQYYTSQKRTSLSTAHRTPPHAHSGP